MLEMWKNLLFIYITEPPSSDIQLIIDVIDFYGPLISGEEIYICILKYSGKKDQSCFRGVSRRLDIIQVVWKNF